MGILEEKSLKMRDLYLTIPEAIQLIAERLSENIENVVLFLFNTSFSKDVPTYTQSPTKFYYNGEDAFLNGKFSTTSRILRELAYIENKDQLSVETILDQYSDLFWKKSDFFNATLFKKEHWFIEEALKYPYEEYKYEAHFQNEPCDDNKEELTNLNFNASRKKGHELEENTINKQKNILLLLSALMKRVREEIKVKSQKTQDEILEKIANEHPYPFKGLSTSTTSKIMADANKIYENLINNSDELEEIRISQQKSSLLLLSALMKRLQEEIKVKSNNKQSLILERIEKEHSHFFNGLPQNTTKEIMKEANSFYKIMINKIKISN